MQLVAQWREFVPLFCGLMLSTVVTGQQTQVLQWKLQPDDDIAGRQVYRPEPILFVHGINANDEGWQTAMAMLQPLLNSYHVSQAMLDSLFADQASGRYNTQQQPYLHTFNYGDPPGVSWAQRLNRQTFDHIEWNAWRDDMQSRTFTNLYAKPTDQNYIQPAPNDQRITLDERINNRLTGIRQAYALDPNDQDTWPRVVLVAHSMGGLLSHYYLIRSAPDTGVRRLVTIATPHQGSHVANWTAWYNHASVGAKIFDGVRAHFMFSSLTKVARPVGEVLPNTAGFFDYGDAGAVEDLQVIKRDGPQRLRHVNDLMNYFWDNPAPTIEYVFNVYQRPLLTPYIVARIQSADQNLSAEQLLGDGVVALWSASGKASDTDPSIWNGWTEYPELIHNVDPVIFGVWENTDHSAAPSHTNSVFKSLCGVPHKWPDSRTGPQPPIYSGFPPSYAQRYDEKQSFNKYLPLSDQDVWHTDEPGIADVKLLVSRASGQNPLLLPTLDTWGYTNDVRDDFGRFKIHTNNNEFSGSQIIAGGSLSIVGLIGAKNRVPTAADVVDTNYWITAGSEYLPASVALRIEAQSSPVSAGVAGNFLTGLVNQCVVQLDENDLPQYQYGCFTNGGSLSVSGGAKNYVAVQGRNLGGLVTPQAERAFEAVSDSTTVVGVLREINRLQELFARTNHCFCVPVVSTNRWTAMVTEVVSLQGNTVTQNFHSAFAGLDSVVGDLFNGSFTVGSEQYSYEEEGHCLTFTDTNNLPSLMTLTYTALLGCRSEFHIENGTNAPVTVPALETDSLAGVPMTQDLLSQMQSGMDDLIPRFLNTQTNAMCVFWTKPDILRAAGFPSTDWLPLADGGRIESAHLQQIQDVLGLLTSTPATNQFSVKLFDAVVITVSPQNPTNVIATASVDVPRICGSRYFLAGGANGTNGICADNAVEVNGTLIEVSGGYQYELGQPIEQYAPRTGPIEVTDQIREGETNQFRVLDWGAVYGLTDIYLVRCPR